MKKLHSFLMALCAVTILSPAIAANSVEQQTEAADAADSRPAPKNAVTPHNHMRDGKGMSIQEKPVQSKKGTPVAVAESETAKSVEKKTPAKRKLRPHSHPQDGKGMYVSEKK
ncbi:MAG: hypothetical protein WKG03_21185 [Telluria sp.]